MRGVDDDLGSGDLPAALRALFRHGSRWLTDKCTRRPWQHVEESGEIEALKIGQHYQTTYGTLWKDGTYFPRGTRVMVAGVHLEQGFCVRFPAEVDGEPLETWEDWGEADF